MFEIHVADTDATSGTIPLTWCFDRETLTALKAFKNEETPNLYVVISIVPLSDGVDESDRKEVRYVVPVNQMMAYVSFKYPGVNRIRAFVVLGTSQNSTRYTWTRAPWDMTTKYNIAIIGREEGEPYHEDTWIHSLANTEEFKGISVQAKPMDVEVPAECFAKEPAAWEKAWVTWLVADDRFGDQCDYRRRRLFAYSFQPFILLGNMMCRVLITFLALVCGAKKLSAKYLLHPLSHTLKSTWSQFEDGIIFLRTDIPEKWQTRLCREDEPVYGLLLAFGYMTWPLLLSPPVLACMAWITLIGAWKTVGMLFLIAVVAILMILAFLLLPEIRGIVRAAFDHIYDVLSRWFSSTDEDLPELLVCSDKPAVVKKTVKLRFQSFKAKVCKPFAG